jgi:predicted nucleic acid-binding protein
VIVYLDSSVLARSYLADEDGHQQATALLEDPEVVAVTGKWTRIEVSGALLRAARTGRNGTSEQHLLALLDADLAENGRVSELTAPQAEVERKTLELVRQHALRTLDTWHLALASLTVPALAAPKKEAIAFASRNANQTAVAERLGFKRV